MHWARAALLLCASSTACRFTVAGAGVDGMSTVPSDMATGIPPADMSGCACATGCSETPTHHCLALQPSGPIVAGDLTAGGVTAVTITGNVTINSDDGSISGAINRPAGAGSMNGIVYRVAPQANGPAVGVFSVAGLTVAAGARVTVKGVNAFALASSAAVEIDGIVDASCTLSVPGPGGSKGGAAGGGAMPDGGGTGGGKAGAVGAGGGSGGGGAGYGDAGGSGGLIATQLASNGGAPWGDLTASTFVLVGGSGGGSGAGPMGGAGGGGGGAVHLAVNGALRIAGIIDVGACGGSKGAKNNGGGGGGSGGAIVLEAGTITLTGAAVLAANGGGGGGGDDDKSNPGADANANTVPAAGGSTMSSGANGGNGGASNATPGQHFTNGRNGLISVGGMVFGGGGGGGAGRIALRAAMNGISDSSSAVTPDAADATIAGQHMTSYGLASFQ